MSSPDIGLEVYLNMTRGGDATETVFGGISGTASRGINSDGHLDSDCGVPGMGGGSSHQAPL